MLHLTPDMLETAYELLRSTPPFAKWSLPDADEVEFQVSRDTATYGHYLWSADHHLIAISGRNCSQLARLVAIMAHEMIHLHQREKGEENKNQHNAHFLRMNALVCKHHGFDPKEFC